MTSRKYFTYFIQGLFVTLLIQGSQGIVYQCFANLPSSTEQSLIERIDDDTPAEGCTVKLPDEDAETNELVLIFSDEFKDESRDLNYFNDDKNWLSNDFLFLQHKLHCTKPSAVEITNGKLRLHAREEESKCFDDFGAPQATRNFTAGSVETWNKFCYTGGYVEIAYSASPGFLKSRCQLYLSLYGNLFRNGKLASLFSQFGNWDYSTCDAGASGDLPWATQSGVQYISACKNNTVAKKLDLERGVGRGSQGTLIGQVIPVADDEFFVDMKAGFRPASPPDRWDDINNLAVDGLTVKNGAVAPEIDNKNSDMFRNTQLASERLDLFNAIKRITEVGSDQRHVVGLWWEPEQFLRWYVDGKLTFSLNQEALKGIENQGVSMGRRFVSREASHISMYVDMTQPLAQGAEAYVDIDYVRVYQQQQSVRAATQTCDPPNLPTKAIIEQLEDKFMWRSEMESNRPKPPADGNDAQAFPLWSLAIIIPLIVGICLVGMFLCWTCYRDANQTRQNRAKWANARAAGFSSLDLEAPLSGNMTAPKVAMPSNIKGLLLEYKLGQGSFGHVYYGKWSGIAVAVKIQYHRSEAANENIESEAQLSLRMKHPNIVTTYYHSVVHSDTVKPENVAPVASAEPGVDGQFYTANGVLLGDGTVTLGSARHDDGPGGMERAATPESGVVGLIDSANSVAEKGLGTPVSQGSKQTEGFGKSPMSGQGRMTSVRSSIDGPQAASNVKHMTGKSEGQHSVSSATANVATWIVQEFCDLGVLDHHCVQTKIFGNTGKPDWNAVIETAMDIARGMQYLHQKDIIHGDLKASNVLLQTSGVSLRGYVAKVADFGLSRKLDNRTNIQTGTLGTVTHMPPEHLQLGMISKKSDVYAYGMLLWELAEGRIPFAGLNVGEVIAKIVVQKFRPSFSQEYGAPKAFLDLTEQCWTHDRDARPNFDDILDQLNSIAQSLK